MLELRQVRSRIIAEKTESLVKSVLDDKVNVETVKETQIDIKILNAEISLLDLVMGLDK